MVLHKSCVIVISAPLNWVPAIIGVTCALKFLHDTNEPIASERHGGGSVRLFVFKTGSTTSSHETSGHHETDKGLNWASIHIEAFSCREYLFVTFSAA
jgi:hypothetical protein